MTRLRSQTIAAVFCAPIMLALAGCEGAEPADTTDEAAEFAARINGPANSNSPAPASGPAPVSGQAPTVAPPRKITSQNQYVSPPIVIPAPRPCDASAMGRFLGRKADDATRLEVTRAAAGAIDVQFVSAESGYVEPDPANPRIHIMLDRQGVIRDALCR